VEDIFAPALQYSNFRIPSRRTTNLGTAPIAPIGTRTSRSPSRSAWANCLRRDRRQHQQRHNYATVPTGYSDAVTGFGLTFVDVNRTTPTA